MADMISLEEWKKIDIRIGKILKVEDIANADKLYKLEVDVGEEKPRILVAGIKKHYKKEELKGKKFIFLCNLEPKTLRGIESNGMILAAVSDDFKNLHNKEISDSARKSEDFRHESEIVLIEPEKDTDIGTRIR